MRFSCYSMLADLYSSTSGSFLAAPRLPDVALLRFGRLAPTVTVGHVKLTNNCWRALLLVLRVCCGSLLTRFFVLAHPNGCPFSFCACARLVRAEQALRY